MNLEKDEKLHRLGRNVIGEFNRSYDGGSPYAQAKKRRVIADIA